MPEQDTGRTSESRSLLPIVVVGTVVLILIAIGIAVAITLPGILTKYSGASTIGRATGETKFIFEEHALGRYFLVYAYEVDGREYEVVGQWFTRDTEQLRWKADNGATVLVTYDPDDPGTAFADDAMPGCAKSLHCEDMHY